MIHRLIFVGHPTFLLTGLTNLDVLWGGDQAHVLVWFKAGFVLVHGPVTSGEVEYVRTKILIYTTSCLKMSHSEMNFFLSPICPEFIWLCIKPHYIWNQTNTCTCWVLNKNSSVNHPVYEKFNLTNLPMTGLTVRG